MYSDSKKKRAPPARKIEEGEWRALERLIKLTVRAFFGPVDIVVIDELILHRSKLKDQALAQLLNLRPKEVQSSLYRMKENWMVSYEMINDKNQVVTSQEENRSNEGPKRVRNKSVIHTLWFIDYPKFMDMLRFKLLKLNETHHEERTYYECVGCHKEYDIYRSFESLECDRCMSKLEKRVSSSGEETNLGALTILMNQLKGCEGVPFPQFEKFITHIESGVDGGAAPKHGQHGIIRMGHKSKRDDIEIVVDEKSLNVRHPASISIFPQENDMTVYSKGAPPWMKKPVDVRLANSGQLIVPAPEKKENTKKKRDFFDVNVTHCQSEEVYRTYYANQMKQMKK